MPQEVDQWKEEFEFYLTNMLWINKAKADLIIDHVNQLSFIEKTRSPLQSKIKEQSQEIERLKEELSKTNISNFAHVKESQTPEEYLSTPSLKDLEDEGYKSLSEKLPEEIFLRIHEDIGYASTNTGNAAKIAFNLCHFIADKLTAKDQRIKELEREVQDWKISFDELYIDTKK